MESGKFGNETNSNESVDESQSAVNNLILDYYKKFGKKRDLEQFFSLSTAQSDIKDPTSSFWKKMKSQTDSDSGEKKSESSTELCRISIQCSIPEPSTSHIPYQSIKSDTESPPIVNEEGQYQSRNSDNESFKSDDLLSHKSVDNTLDTSLNKPHSPTSSITSQRKLEWDSLADVGYANESDRKNSASSLSTLERLALHQQYSNNDKQNMDIGPPTAQSTPLDIDNCKNKNKKALSRKSTKIYKKDVDCVQFNVPNNENLPQPINVNLTKHISFNVEKDGGITIENITRNVSLSPDKEGTQTDKKKPQEKSDKEIQTTMNKNEDNAGRTTETKNKNQYPVLISLNSLRKRKKKKKIKKNLYKQSKRRVVNKENVPLEKSDGQVSEAESFEYMPGNIYNLNQMKKNDDESEIINTNKSNQGSSTGLTTDSSRTSKYSFTKDLNKCIDVLKTTLNNKCDNKHLKTKLVKEIVQRLIQSNLKDDGSSTEFLSGLSFDSKKLDLLHSNQTTSTSDTNNTQNFRQVKPKKSILRMDTFNSTAIASTSQSVPNLPTVTQNENPISYSKNLCDLSNTDSDLSNKTKKSTGVDKTSSEHLYNKYLEALNKEQAYKKYLKEKELFLKHKLVSSDLAFNVSKESSIKTQKVKELMNDLVRNNYDDGSGDASKLEVTYCNNTSDKYNSICKQRSHSVYTLSSGASDNKQSNDRTNTKKYCKKTNEHQCCCLFHKSPPKVDNVDSSVQVNLSPKNGCAPDLAPNSPKKQEMKNKCLRCSYQSNNCPVLCGRTTDIKYVCLCTDDSHEVPENILIYKCSRQINKCLKTNDKTAKDRHTENLQNSSSSTSTDQKSSFRPDDCEQKCLIINDNFSQTSKSSQTNVNFPLKLQSRSSEQSIKSISSGAMSTTGSRHKKIDNVVLKHEATRWIQTEISIDPKISDPSLSDINVVNDKDCAQLVCEQYKKTSKPSSQSKVLNEFDVKVQEAKASTSGGSKSEEEGVKRFNKNKITLFESKIVEKQDKGIQIIPDDMRHEKKEIQSSDNFTIPIQGTNMTLKVSLGSQPDYIKSPEVEKTFALPMKFTSRGTETVKNNVVENFTSLREECSKYVQSSDNNILKEIYREPTSNQISEKAAEACKDTEQVTTAKNENSRKSGFYINTCIADNIYNTYPKNDRNRIQKPLLRSNTDTSKIASHVALNQNMTKEIGIQSNNVLTARKHSKGNLTENTDDGVTTEQKSSNKKIKKPDETPTKSAQSNKCPTDATEEILYETTNSESDTIKPPLVNDPILDIIQDITKRYAKKDVDKIKRKKCFKEIITVLNYLLDTEESTNGKVKESSSSSAKDNETKSNLLKNENNNCIPTKKLVDKGVQLSAKKSCKICTNSSDLPVSTDVPSTSTDSGTCKILNKIKRECDRYHQKRCKIHPEANPCETSSSTSVNCHQCRRVHHCSCKTHKCKSYKKTVEKSNKKCVAYNLIIQTSDSMVSEEINYDHNRRHLKNIIVKVPSKRKVQNLPFKEVSSKIEKNLPKCSNNNYQTRNIQNDSEISSTDDPIKQANACTVREYLERNRPDFVEKTSNRQHCLKVINETRATERAAKRQLLSLQLDRQEALSTLTTEELDRLARLLGNELRKKTVAPKFISEREMKQHSEKIYKSLPEVLHKKEERKKENIKKANLLMANIFKKNLQKKTLQGAVNISNYSTVVKI